MESKLKKRAVHRLRILEGQIRGLERMVSSEQYCPDILSQCLAAHRSFESFQLLLLENHLKTHVRKDMRNKKEGKAIKELLEIYKYALKGH